MGVYVRDCKPTQEMYKMPATMLSEPQKYELRENERPVSDHEYSGDYKDTDMRWKWTGGWGRAIDFHLAVKEYGYDNVRWSTWKNGYGQHVVEVYCKLK